MPQDQWTGQKYLSRLFIFDQIGGENYMYILPTYKGYTVDERLKEFRKINYGEMPKFKSFESSYGKKLLSQYRKEQSMKILTKEILEKLPALYSQENVEDPMIVCKFFYPDFGWTWYAIEFDGKDTFYGYVVGDFPELGYFALSELLANRGKLGMPIERDLYFKPCRLSEVMVK
jgi:hypothetical protein